MSVRICAPSRLHFGPLSLPSGPAHWADLDGGETVPARHFGGVGLMIERPGIQLLVEPAETWSAHGPRAERALAYAQHFAATVADGTETRFLEETGFLRSRVSPCRITVESCAPEHAGLGTGTQLGLAVARALADLWGLTNLSSIELARRVGRGTRSALGIHGFEHGGFLVDGGKGAATALAPLVARAEFPQEWRVLVIVPPGQGLHGASEKTAFAHLSGQGGPHQQPHQHTEALCRLVLLGLLPALAERDLATFGECLYDFNRRAGELFREVQGGIYGHPQTAAIVAHLRQQGIAGVGQSSWGPAVFAVVEEDRADLLASRLQKRLTLAPEQIWVTRPANQRARLIPGAGA